ncbi:MAG: hypothetical protein LAQ69_36800 [Acidobacteriia bacterium]|nr:hypothetical protein [Terriglobia bacterium]
MIRVAVLSAIVCACAILSFGQAENALARVRALNLPILDGGVTVIYSPSAKARAQRYQAALEAAHKWYEAQLGVSVPVTLAVLDKPDWERATSVPYPMPNAKTGLVTVPSRMEDFPGFADMQADADILAETISFHEMGHIFADDYEGIRSRNSWVNELVPNIFAQEYICARQPGLKAFMPRPVPDALLPRYTSLADFDYLTGVQSVPFSNYAWFQFHLNRLAFFVAQKRGLPQVVEQLKLAFPAAQGGYLPSEEVLRRMETIAPGFTAELGLLSGPATITRVDESICSGATASEGAPTLLVVDNRTSREMTVSQDGKSPIRLAAGRWRRLNVRVGEKLKLSSGSCLVASGEPTLAVIEKP